jgi:hypothetical protein
MKVVKIRERKNEWQVYEKDSNRIVFRGSSRLDCKKFLAGKAEYSYEPTREKGIHYVY